jgi:hypothetical protein
MELSAACITLGLHNLPAAQKAAVLYANGREARHSRFPARHPAARRAGAESPDLWYMLFDLLRAAVETVRGAGGRFTAAFGISAPQWLNEEEMARLPTEIQPGTPATSRLSRPSGEWVLNSACAQLRATSQPCIWT